MLRPLAAALAATLALAPVARAGDDPVVVELFTSQGCSSCPAADALLTELAAREDVIALALHVDYWDYIGWKDIFGDPAFTRRQKAYAHAARARTIYTPQMVIGGEYHVVGNRADEVARSIAMRQAHPDAVEVAVSGDGGEGGFRISLAAAALPQPAVVQVVRYRPEASVDIERGENAGRTILYSNIVTDWAVLDRWDGRAEWHGAVRLAPGEKAVVIVQAEGPGPVLGSARLR